MSETVLILRANKYEFTNEKNGEIIKGCNVHYVSEYQEETATAVGDMPVKVSASEEVFAEIKKNKAPGIYQISTRSKPGKDGQATMVLVQAEFIKGLSLAQYR